MVVRQHDAVSSTLERRLLVWMCAKMPSWITPDKLTSLGVFGGVLTFSGYLSSRQEPCFLLLAATGIVLNWLGDSLDGTLARFRNEERPKYGMFLDHMCDSFVMLMTALGAGLSGYVSLASVMTLLASYLLLTILSVLYSAVSGVMRISFAGVGPTEVRLAILVMTGFVLWNPQVAIEVFGNVFPVYDTILFALACILTLTCLYHAVLNVRQLAQLDPVHKK